MAASVLAELNAIIAGQGGNVQKSELAALNELAGLIAAGGVTVAEVDGAPSGTVTTIKVPNGALSLVGAVATLAWLLLGENDFSGAGPGLFLVNNDDGATVLKVRQNGAGGNALSIESGGKLLASHGGDLTFDSARGAVLVDRADGHTYRLKTTAGVLGTEQVS